jgi:alpha-amylase
MAYAANRHAYDDDAPKQNYTLLQAFEWYTPGQGQHWTWLKNNAERFGKMGITAVWIPPPYKASQQDSTGEWSV